MIKFKLESKNDVILSFTLSGHSTTEKKGNNLLCAGVSTLVQTIILALKNVISVPFHFEKEDGYIHCQFDNKLTDQQLKEVRILVNTMIVGLNDLKKQFPEEIQIEFK